MKIMEPDGTESILSALVSRDGLVQVTSLGSGTFDMTNEKGQAQRSSGINLNGSVRVKREAHVMS